jgi:hypothetical protein
MVEYFGFSFEIDDFFGNSPFKGKGRSIGCLYLEKRFY